MTTATRPQTEAQFQQAVIDYAKLMGWKVFHPYDSRKSEPGYPDLTMVRDGTLVFAELKRDGRPVSTAQSDWLLALGSCPGIVARRWDPRDWPEIEKVLA